MGNPPQVPPGGITKGDLRALVFVVIAGAVGGFLFWVLAALAGQRIGPSWPVYVQILAMTFVGAIAGLFGVYLLTASDIRALKTFVFAIVCGLVWQPILQSAKGLVSSATASRQIARLDTKTDQIKVATQNGTPEQVKSEVSTTASILKDALSTLPGLQDTAKRDELLNKSKNAVDALESAFPKAPVATVDALTDVGLESTKANQPEIATKAIQALNAVGIGAVQRGQSDVARKAYRSIQAIGSQSVDASVRDSAEGSMKDVLGAID